jgi:hypothetical protein
MTLAGAPLGALLAALGVGGAGLVALYVLRLRRRRLEVPFVKLWQRVLNERESTALWRRLRRLLSLLVMLVLLGLLVAALADPRLGASQRGRTLALLVDVSASMQARDGAGGVSRLDEAKEAARRIVRGLGAEDQAIVVAMDARPAPASGLSSDDRELLRAVDGLAARNSSRSSLDRPEAPADLERALRLAADVLRGRPNPSIVLIGDGAWDDTLLSRIRLGAGGAPGPAARLAPIDLSGIDLRYQPVGQAEGNLAITAFAVRRYRSNRTAYEVLVEVQSFAKDKVTALLELNQDDEPVEVEKLTLEPGDKKIRIYPNLAGTGTRLSARLRAEAEGAALDPLALDDVAYAVLPPRQKVKVLLVSAGNLFVEGALLLDENLEVKKIAPGAWDAAEAARFDAVVLDGVTPEPPPPGHALYLDPKGAASPFKLRGEVAAPYITETAKDHPLMRWVSLADLNISRASRFELAAGDVAVASAFRQPIVAARDRGGRKTVAIGFDVGKSDLPLRVAFPVLVVNALDWFAGEDAGLRSSLSTGVVWRLPAAPGLDEIEVQAPDGQSLRAPAHDGRAAYLGQLQGFYQVRGGAETGLIAANLASPAESRIAPRRQLNVDGRAIAAPEPGRLGVRRALWPYFLLVALLVFFVEFWAYNRRVTV